MIVKFYLVIPAYLAHGEKIPEHGFVCSTNPPNCPIDGDVRYTFSLDVPALDGLPAQKLEVLSPSEKIVTMTPKTKRENK
jgi:hypothetical protein